MLTQEQVNEILRWWSLFKHDGDLVEIRMVPADGKKTYSGYYRNVDNLIRDVAAHPDYNIYFTVNAISDACYERPQHEHLAEYPKNTTTDQEISRRTFVFLDIDCRKPAGVNSTDAEKHHAHLKAVEIFRYLKNQGFPDPIVCDSANGYHIYIPCDMPNDEAHTILAKRFTASMAVMFSDDKVDIDLKVFNAARIAKLPGTFSRKGASSSTDRPQRMCKILLTPKEKKIADEEYFLRVASNYPDEPKQQHSNFYPSERFSLDDFIAKHGIPVTGKATVADGTRYYLQHCLFDSNHKGKDAVLFQHNNGAVAYKCYHNSCSCNDWQKVRLMYEPDAYDRKEVASQRYDRYRQMNKQQLQQLSAPKTIELTPTKGDVWIKISTIETPKFSLSDYIPSGIGQIDSKIVGWRRKHVSVWSGIRGCGKSSLLNQIILNAANKGYSSALWTGELDGSEVKKWLYLQSAGAAYNEPTAVPNIYFTPSRICTKIDPWIDKYFWLFNNEYGSNFQSITDQVRKLKEEQDIDMVIFDNLMTLDLDGLDGDKYDRQKDVMLTLVRLARELDIHIHIVAHPNKSAGFLRPNHISGSGNIPDLAQNIFIMHRINQDFATNARDFLAPATTTDILASGCSNVIEICKCRERGYAVDTFIKLWFEMESNRLKNDKFESVVYGWCEQPMQQYIPLEPIAPNTAFDSIEPSDPNPFDYEGDTPF